MLTEDIITDRLVLRTMTQDDAADVWSLWGDREVGKYLADPYYESPEVLRGLFHDIETWSDYAFVAHARDTGAFIGTCSVGPEAREDEWGFGYCVRKADWGKGYATEMARAMIALAYAKGIRDFTATFAAENAASGRVMAKCGMRLDHESSFKKRGTDIVYPSRVYKMHLD